MSATFEPDVTPEGRWVFSCGCGNVVRVKNAALRTTTDGCDHCRAAMDGTEIGFDVSDGRVGRELGWCGCGDPESPDRMMLAYLDARSVEPFPKPRADGVSEDAELLLAFIADALGWTEHGGSVGGAWLTDDGQEARSNLRAVVENYDHS